MVSVHVGVTNVFGMQPPFFAVVRVCSDGRATMRPRGCRSFGLT